MNINKTIKHRVVRYPKILRYAYISLLMYISYESRGLCSAIILCGFPQCSSSNLCLVNCTPFRINTTPGMLHMGNTTTIHLRE